MTRQELIHELASIVLESVNMTHISPESVTADTTLMNGGLDLDSIDMLSCVVVLEKKFSVNITNATEGKAIFQNFGTIADFIQKNSAVSS